MSYLRGRVLPVTLAAVVLVGGANLAAYAANGHPLLLGGKNSETKTATVTNTGKGAALSLNSSKKSPPLAVNSSKVVKHLNADKVGGKSATDLADAGHHVDGPRRHRRCPYALNGLPKGIYLAMLTVRHARRGRNWCATSTDSTAPYDLLSVRRQPSFGVLGRRRQWTGSRSRAGQPCR